jgi:hypothetical protein
MMLQRWLCMCGLVGQPCCCAFCPCGPAACGPQGFDCPVMSESPGLERLKHCRCMVTAIVATRVRC